MTDYKRSKLRNALLKELGAGDAAAEVPLLRYHVDTYLDTIETFNYLRSCAKEISEDPKKVRLYLAYTAEARHQEKAARDILIFLGISGNPKLTRRDTPLLPL